MESGQWKVDSGKRTVVHALFLCIVSCPLSTIMSVSAPGKIILVGEHAVVYGQPAIAVPVWETQATATITERPVGSGCVLIAPQIDLHIRLNVPDKTGEALQLVTHLALQKLSQEKLSPQALEFTDDPDWQIELESQIPIASGMGSGAAICAALVRAIYAHVQQPVDAETVSQIVYQSEQLYHGTPSGIDNTVIAYGMPLWFVRNETGPPTMKPFQSEHPFTVAIADSGVASSTKEAVGQVRRAWQRDPNTYNQAFATMGQIARHARVAMETGDLILLGQLFDQNQSWLEKIDVSSPELDRLIVAAREQGAFGAKLSGGGKGGNMIALVNDDTQQAVVDGLMAAGAKRVIVTQINS